MRSATSGLGLQPKLLRVLQERSFERLGSNVKIEYNIRWFAQRIGIFDHGSTGEVPR